MAQQQSQLGQVGFKTQAAQGVYDSPGAAAPNNGVFSRVSSGSMGGNRDLLVPDPEIGGTRDRTEASLGPIVFEGDYEMYARLETIATLLQGALGPGTTVANGTAFTHTIVQNDGAVELPWLSVEEGIGQDMLSLEYTDARVNTFSLEADADGYLMSNAGLAAVTSTEGNPRTDLTTAPASTYVDVSPLIVGSEITVTYNGLSLCAKSFSLEINNNLETDDFCLGKYTVDTFTPKRREVDMGITIRPEDGALWKRAMYGSEVATTPGTGQAARAAAQVTITSTTLIPGSAIPYSITIDVPVSVIQPYEVEPSGDDVIETDLEIMALRPDPGVDLMTVAITNGYDSIR